MITKKILEDLKEKIKAMSHYESADGQDLVMVADVGQCIDEYIDMTQNVTIIQSRPYKRQRG